MLQISLAAARVNSRLTQEQVAKLLNVSKKTIINWERGKAKPSYATLQMLSEIYLIPVDNIKL